MPFDVVRDLVELLAGKVEELLCVRHDVILQPRRKRSLEGVWRLYGSSKAHISLQVTFGGENAGGVGCAVHTAVIHMLLPSTNPTRPIRCNKCMWRNERGDNDLQGSGIELFSGMEYLCFWKGIHSEKDNSSAR